MKKEPTTARSASLWSALAANRSTSSYAESRTLFCCGEQSRGVFLVEEGVIELFLSGKDGKEKSLGETGPGSILGVSEAISGGLHKVTAVARSKTRVIFAAREELLKIMKQNPGLCMDLVRLLSEDLHVLYRQCQHNSLAPEPPRARLHEEPRPSIRRPN